MGQTISNSFVWTRGGDAGDEEADETALETVGPSLVVPIKLDDCSVLPKRSTADAAGFDLCANERVVLAPTATFFKIRTGVRMAIGTQTAKLHFGDTAVMYGMIRGRSGLASKGIECFHGTIDADYRGELMVMLKNTTGAEFVVEYGDRIAQIVFSVALTPSLLVCESVSAESETARGEGGFGSTGGVAAVAVEPVVDGVAVEADTDGEERV
jgi:dUTP pyrophosphatase